MGQKQDWKLVWYSAKLLGKELRNYVKFKTLEMYNDLKTDIFI